MMPSIRPRPKDAATVVAHTITNLEASPSTVLARNTQKTRSQLTRTLHSLGDLSLDRSDPDTALRRFAKALAYAVATGNPRLQIYCVAGIACAQVLREDARAAARLWGTAEDQERRLGYRMLLNERQRYENLIAGARDRLGSAYDTERRAGAGLTLEQAVAEARRHLPASVARP
jgi:hypothetical protein